MPPQLRHLRLLVLGAGALLTACSTIVSGTGQQVAIRTPGVAGATCHLTGGDGVDMTVSSPATIHVSKSRNNIKVACQTPTNQTATATLKSTYSNFSIVEYPLGYGVDAITGAMWVYPKTLDVTVNNPAQPG